MKLTNTVAQFIPIVVIFLLLSQYQGCVKFSHTILGKIMAAFVILFYTTMDKVLGLFVCALIILFYQMDCRENMLNIESFDTIEEEEEEKEDELEYNETKPAKSCNACGVKNIETFENYESSNEKVVDNGAVQDEFRKEHCQKGVLKHKDMDVKNEMAQHVYPELKFQNDYCNACSPTCKFSIVESKLKTETQLLPKVSKENLTIM
mgnify:FL=1